MAALIQSIVIGGSKDSVNIIEITEADGDRSVMTVTRDIATSARRESIDLAKSHAVAHS